MPEGPEVRTIVDGLVEKIKGVTVINVTIDEEYRYYKDKDTWLSNIKLYPVIEGVECKGKNIFFHLRGLSSREGKNIYLHSHLGMTGKWLWEPQKHTKITLELLLNIPSLEENKEGDPRREVGYTFKLYYDDVRKYGRLTWMEPEVYAKKMKFIGLDMLGDVTLKEWISTIKTIIQNKRIKPKQVCEFLMSQKWISGVGNYLKAEILYASRIRPDRIINFLTEEEVEFLYEMTKKTIMSSYLSQGLTIRSYEGPSGKKGTFKVMIYDKKKCPLGYNVVVTTFKDNRKTHWVPEIQK